MIPNKLKSINKNPQGSSLLSPAQGRAGARATLLSFCLLVPPPSEKIAGGFQQAGKKEGSLGEGIFARLPSREAGLGWKETRPCSSKETKPAKIDSLIEKEFCARPLKEKEIFAGFVRRQAASRWGGFLPVRAEILAQNGFALRSVIATKFFIDNEKYL